MLPRSPARPTSPLTRDRQTARKLLATVVCAVLTATLLAFAAPAQGAGDPQPGDFRGRGFDQCMTPSYTAMHRWLYYSPFQAVGIYMSGDSRACRHQPNLTPSWVRTQIHQGWHLLPITLGPQAYCNPRYPRYNDDRVIYRSATDRYANARRQGYNEGRRAGWAARGLGIAAKSTLWYDIEAFNTANTQCLRSTMAFLEGWTRGVHSMTFVSGVYSSAASGIRALENERANPTWYHWLLPDRIWIADWDGRMNVLSEFLRTSFWLPGNRMKQYRGGHDETWGGIRINIDSDWLELGDVGHPKPDGRRCGGVNINFGSYATLRPGTVRKYQVRALQCLLREKRYYTGTLSGVYTAELIRAANRFKAAVGRPASNNFTPGDWVALVANGRRVTLKWPSTDPAVFRLQRALNAAQSSGLSINGWFDRETVSALRTYQRRVGLVATGHAAPTTWGKLLSGAR